MHRPNWFVKYPIDPSTSSSNERLLESARAAEPPAKLKESGSLLQHQIDPFIGASTVGFSMVDLLEHIATNLKSS
jgi:hypothetical protein